ncbi:hypothetical protein HU200_046837 [Digitaria exilis]|uniref:Uncharacterized protein n=1 Tax=Digitaria exilis TaxID=1010633 RepID=A0A835EAS0_9POAL|nr:hypothetical protein HU200_046837 [Digitaria exilis]
MVLVRRSLSMSRLRSCHEADDRGWNPLHVAARKGNLKEVGAYLAIAIDALVTFHPRLSVLTFDVRRLLDEGMDVNAPAWGPKSPGATALHLAAQGGHVKIMDELLERGANIDARTKGACGWTPLHIAAKERNKKAVRFLIENGAFLPPEMNDHRFNPPLHYCSGLEWAYEMKRMQDESDSPGESSSSSD